jgi:hypothetical protein
MREVGTILGGMGLLIFAYLVFSNSGAANTIITGTSSSAVNIIGALQGKGSGTVV